MLNARFGRSTYLNATVKELKVLSKLLGLLPPNHHSHKVNWVDQLMLEHQELKVVDWGTTDDSDNSLDIDLFKLEVFDAWSALGSSTAHPSLIERAIIAKVLEIRASSFTSSSTPTFKALLQQGINLEPSELELCERLERVYKVKALMEQIIDVMSEL